MGSISVLCQDSDCEARWIGAVDNSDLFVCKCVPEKGGILAFKDLKELEEYFREDEDLIIRNTDNTDEKDSIENIRIVECNGYKCRTKYGDGICIHCESCHDHLVHYLR